MRVLHLSDPAVDTRYFATLIPALTQRGLEVHCGTVQTSSAPGWLENTRGATHFSLGVRPRRGRWFATAAARLGAYVRRNRVDVVQTHLFNPGIVGVLGGRVVGRPVIVTRHHTDEMELVGTRMHVLGDRLTARGATRMLGFSEAVRDRLVEGEGVDPSKVEVIPQGFDFDSLVPIPDRVAALRAELGLEGRFVIGDVARFFATKGQAVLLRAARLLSEEIPDLSVLLVGGGDLSGLRALAEAEGVADRTIVTGHRDDTVTCLGAMDIVVHPSFTEAFSQVLVEAMSAGRPVVATDVASASEIIDHEVSGLLVEPHDPQAIVRAVKRLHCDSELRDRIAGAGQRSVRARFPVKRMVDAQVAMYEGLSAGG